MGGTLLLGRLTGHDKRFPKPKGTIWDLLLLGAWEMKQLDMPLRQMLVGWQNGDENHTLNLMGFESLKQKTPKKFKMNPPKPL